MKSMADYKLPLPCHRRAKPRQSGRDTQSVPANRALVLCTSHFSQLGKAKETSEQEIVDSKQQLGLSGNRAPQNLMGNHQFFYPKNYVDRFTSFRQTQI
jgi:hypothetical protein